MPGQAYPLGIAIKGAGGRKTKENRHIRSSRARRRAFWSEVEKLVKQYNRKSGKPAPVNIDDEELERRAAADPDFAELRNKVFDVRMKYLGY